MHTIMVISGGLALLAVMLLLGISRAALWFIPIWLVCAAINMWVGVSGAGNSVAAELPIFVLVFAVILLDEGRLRRRRFASPGTASSRGEDRRAGDPCVTE